MFPSLDRAHVGGFDTVLADRFGLAQWIDEVCVQKPPRPALVFSSNGQGIALAGSNADYDAAMAAADVIHADGMPVVMASKLLTRTPIAGRSATTDLFHDVSRLAQGTGRSYFILGASEAQNRAAVERVREIYPAITIAGRRNGYFSEDESASVCEDIVASGADIVWVGLGKPKQEIWCHANRDRLRGVSVIKTCGGLCAHLAGDEPRAPRWMQKSGVEWLYRLSRDPKRLSKRYLQTNPVAAYRLVRGTRSLPAQKPWAGVRDE
ncbi:MAG: WecB/TagA/CpsF family glycosyltransferase [Devosiaceae bacterium]|nr:WecB/TagA/CpsF family glycosyltransferase [Devosiaceae bacterium MH13]